MLGFQAGMSAAPGTVTGPAERRRCSGGEGGSQTQSKQADPTHDKPFSEILKGYL